MTTTQNQITELLTHPRFASIAKDMNFLSSLTTASEESLQEVLTFLNAYIQQEEDQAEALHNTLQEQLIEMKDENAEKIKSIETLLKS